MARPTNRADRLPLLACVLAALCGCAGLQEAGRNAGPPAAEQISPPLPAAAPAAAAPPEQVAPDTTASLLPPPAPEPARTLDLLHYAEQYAGLPLEAQRQTIMAAETRYNAEQTSFALVHYALLLSLSEPDRQADAGATDKLRGLIAEPVAIADQDLVPFAQMLAHVLEERERLLAQNGELQRKLDQLKAIEQQLGDRVETPATTP